MEEGEKGSKFKVYKKRVASQRRPSCRRPMIGCHTDISKEKVKNKPTCIKQGQQQSTGHEDKRYQVTKITWYDPTVFPSNTLLTFSSLWPVPKTFFVYWQRTCSFNIHVLWVRSLIINPWRGVQVTGWGPVRLAGGAGRRRVGETYFYQGF